MSFIDPKKVQLKNNKKNNQNLLNQVFFVKSGKVIRILKKEIIEGKKYGTAS